ncbi:MAG: GGDEF domain-containing protein [Candidatus Firestonebacteria bacterium]|nr:GGDEF domain-containing protein [Candidatus Firestonebacteria bacterium]
MDIKSKIHLGNLIIIAISFTSVSLIIYFTSGVNLYWHLYAIPLLIAALTYDLIGGIIAGLISAISIGWWIFSSNLLLTNPIQAKVEIPLGAVLFIGMGVALGILSNKHSKQKEILEGMSIHDRLTGLYNYGYFLDRIEQEKKRADRYSHSLAFVIFDLDHFKKFNDTYGHEQGNNVLRKLANIIKNKTRNIDTTARYGGEEFVIVVPMASEDQAYQVAERVRESVENEKFDGNAATPIVKMTISGGICAYPIDSQNTMELIYKADEALYAAKNEGRNRIYKYSEIKARNNKSKTVNDASLT